MRRFAFLAVLATMAAVVAPSGQATPRAATVFLDPGPGGFTSSNVTYVGSLPTGAGVSARVVTVKGQRRLYLSSAHSLTIYDISDPSLPVPLGVLPIYNWENEDIAVSKDGATTILTEFTDTFYLHVVDTSNPRTPLMRSSVLLDGSHTAECADVHCHYLFASNGKTYDIRNGVQALPREKWWSTMIGARGAHALHQDGAGYWIADETPIVMFRADNPLRPHRITSGDITLNTNYQHNNVRPAAAKYHPRKRGDRSKALRAGELLMTEGESNFEPQCGSGNGAFATWSMVNFDKGAPLRQLHVLRPVNGDYTGGDPAINALGCSGHWFTVRQRRLGRYDGNYLTANAWYEHGTRFLAVNNRTGTIRQVGFFQPVRGSASSAYWIPGTDYVYVVDYQRGVDILKFDAAAAPPTGAETTQSWLAKLHTVDTLSQEERFWCRQAMKHPAHVQH
jgi:LVIVD repeat